MSFDPKKRRFGWTSRAVLLAAALVLLPMAAPRVVAEVAAPATEAAVAPAVKTSWPVIVKTEPAIGATDVDPALTKLTVTFDRPMAEGFSWTGGGEFFPKGPEGAMPEWKDKRTCVLPVILKRGAFYRVGINSTSYRNFKSETGVPAETAAIYFATKGAERAVLNRVRVPKVVKLMPENGATEVDPKTKMIRVTFDMPMGEGFSFTGGGPNYPGSPAGQGPKWSADGKTCLLPVALQPGHEYELGFNSVSHKNFQSKWGVPLVPVRYSFKTSGESVADVPAHEKAAIDPADPPQIVKMYPENGATDVDPAITELTVTFDRPMAEGFSWTGGGEMFPTIPEGEKPSWTKDGKTCTLPVELAAGKQYRLGLNSRSYKNFASTSGVPLVPVVYEFRTSPGN